MREIKFRAWNKLALIYLDDVCIIGDGNYDISPLILEQYTGLKDKNGKEIYEGDRVIFIDVLDGNSSTITANIVFYQTRCQFMPQESTKNYKGGYTIHHWDFIDNIEIIGHIHENCNL